MIVSEAQADLRRAYVGGGPGVMVSATVWLIAALVTRYQGIPTGFAALFIGGMFIFPLSKLLLKTLFKAPSESRDNPLAAIALESTIAMIGGLLAAWLFLRFEPWLVFPVAAIAVGTHYFAFRSVYGDRQYWMLGGILTTLGVVEALGVTSLGVNMIYLVALVEALFAIRLTRNARREFGGGAA